MKKFEKAKAYVKEHKKELITTAAIGAGAIVLGVVGVKISKGVKPVEDEMFKGLFEIKPSNFQFGIGTVTDIWTEADMTHFIINDVPINDLGAFGEAIKRSIPDIADDEVLGMVGCLSKDYNIVG